MSATNFTCPACGYDGGDYKKDGWVDLQLEGDEMCASCCAQVPDFFTCDKCDRALSGEYVNGPGGAMLCTECAAV